MRNLPSSLFWDPKARVFRFRSLPLAVFFSNPAKAIIARQLRISLIISHISGLIYINNATFRRYWRPLPRKTWNLSATMSAQIDRLVQWMSWVAVLGIIILSVVPGDVRPHTGAPGQGEHAIAYFLTAFLFGLRGNSPSQLVRIALILIAGTAVLETAQLWIPGRNSQVGDFVASSLGILVGLAAGYLLAPVYRKSLALLPG